MARFDAIAAVTSAVRDVLAGAARADGEAIDVAAVVPGALTASLPQGRSAVAVWLHRVSPCPQRRPVAHPQREPALLPGVALDLRYLVVARASDPVVQHRSLGWAIRVLEDQPSLPASVLNQGAFDACFRPDESVELTLDPLTSQEENDAWQVAQTARHPAAAYVARMVVLDSRQPLPGRGRVVERDVELAVTP